MRITFLVERPTQFEAPFYRFAARCPAPEHELRVIFLAPDAAAPAFDPELSRPVDWGLDLLGGYPHAVCPPRGRARFLARELAAARPDLLIVNGYTRAPYLRANAMARRRGIATALRLDTAVFPPAGPPSVRDRLRRLLFTRVVARTYDLFLGAGSLTLDYLRTCGVPRERTGLFP